MHKRYFYGYNIVAAGFVIQAVCYGTLFTYGIFLKEFQAEFGWSRAAISGAWSLAFLIMGPVGILAGRLNDKMGPRVIIITTSISLGLGYLLMSGMDRLWQLYLLFGVLVCMGFGAHDVITLSTVARWFEKRRGMMSGIVKVGTGAGQLLIPMTASWLIAISGWRRAYVFIGAAALLVLVGAALLLRRDPREMGLLPDEDPGEPCGTQADCPDAGVSFKTALKTRQLWAICLAEFAAFFCLLTIIVHIVPHARDLHLSPGMAAAVISTIGGVSMVGRMVLGTSNDRKGGKQSLFICFSILLAALVWLLFAREAWMLFLFALFFGFAHGGVFTVMSPTVAEFFGTRSHGVLFGLVLSWGTLGGAVGPLLAGYIFDVTRTYRVVFLLLIGMALLGFFQVTQLRPLKGTRP